MSSRAHCAACARTCASIADNRGHLRGTGYLGGARRTGTFTAQAPRKQPKVAWKVEANGVGGSEWGGAAVLVDGVIYSGGSGYAASYSATTIKGKAG